MASKFFHVHHEFRAGKAQQWWETAQAAMAPGGGWDEAVAKNLEAGFYNHSFCPVGPEGPAFCIWEVREGITAEEFQEFIDGPNGVNFGLGAWMNICREINVEMAGNPRIRESSESPHGRTAPAPAGLHSTGEIQQLEESAIGARSHFNCGQNKASVRSVL